MTKVVRFSTDRAIVAWFCAINSRQRSDLAGLWAAVNTAESWAAIPGGITRETLADSLRLLPTLSSRQ